MMVRNLLLGLAAMAVVGSAGAQTLTAKSPQRLVKNSSKSVQSNKFSVRPGVSSVGEKSKLWVSPQKFSALPRVKAGVGATTRDAETNKVWFSYINSADINVANLGSGITSYIFANLVPPMYAGGKIDSVAVMFCESSVIDNVKVWFAPIEYDNDGYVALPDPDDVAYSFDIDKSLIQDTIVIDNGAYYRETRAKLPQEYEVPEQGCVMGYSFTFTGDYNVDYPVVLMGTDTNGGGFYYLDTDLDGDGETDGWVSMYGTNMGNITLSALVDVTGLPSSNVSMVSFTETTGRTNVQTAITGIIANDGFSPVESISYVLTLNGGTPQEEQTITFAQPIEGQSTGMANFPVTPTINGENMVTVQITKVNGVDNISTSATGSGVVLGLSNPYARTSVVEGFAGTWDGFTPIVYKGFEKLAQDFGGGGIITLAAHFYTTDGTNVYVDPMQCDDYVDVANTYGADIPIAFYDRMFTGDPYAGIEYSNDGTHYQYGATRSVQIIGANYPSEAELTLDASYANFAQTSINADVTVNFACNRLTAPYAIAFVLSEDGMTGTDNSWMQANYFSTADYSDLAQYVEAYNVPDMQDWFNAAGSVATTYDDVIVAAWQPVSGYSNSISAPILVGVPKQFSQTLDISANTLIQNKNNLELTALLINTNTGGIVNAVQVPLGTGTGIEGVENAGSDAVEVARYNANGVLLDAPQKGLNIIKYSDGSVKKVMVK